MLNGIIFRLRSGCQWNRLPKELGDDSTIHRTFQRWVGTGVLLPNVGSPLEGCEELDGWTGNGRRQTEPWARHVLGCDLIGPNPTDRGKAGTKRSLLVDGFHEAAPHAETLLVVAGGNVLGAKVLEATLDRHRLRTTTAHRWRDANT